MSDEWRRSFLLASETLNYILDYFALRQNVRLLGVAVIFSLKKIMQSKFRFSDEGGKPSFTHNS
mgnify:CR=1 FL=1